MDVCVFGIDHRIPIEIRERATYTYNKMKLAISALTSADFVCEFVILNTCNRSEIYFTSKNVKLAKSKIREFFSQFHNISMETLQKHSYFYSGKKAVVHLFNVATGLKSLVIGEDQILGQIKNAHDDAMAKKTSKAILNRVFQSAIATAKRIKSITGISSNPLSVSSVGIKMLQKHHRNNLQDKNALLIGTGKMGLLTLKYLHDAGINELYITNRTHHKAAAIKDLPPYAQLVQYDDRYKYINRVDIIISSTSSPHYTMNCFDFKNCYDKSIPLTILDMAVPRDIEPDIAQIHGVTIFTIDDLGKVVKKNLKLRDEIKVECKQIIELEVESIFSYISDIDKQEIVRLIHSKAKQICNRQITLATEKLNISDQKSIKIISKIIKNSVNSITNPLINSAKETKMNQKVYDFIKKSLEK